MRAKCPAMESGKSNVNLAGATDCSQSVFPVVSTRFDKQTVAPRHHITFTGINSPERERGVKRATQGDEG
jgi:hypothetical protein